MCRRRWKGELSFRSVESIVGVGFYDSGWGLQVESRLLVIFLRKALADHSFSLLSTSTLTQGRNKLTVTRLLHDFQEPSGPTVFVGNYFQQFYVSQNSSSCSKKIMGLSFFFEIIYHMVNIVVSWEKERWSCGLVWGTVLEGFAICSDKFCASVSFTYIMTQTKKFAIQISPVHTSHD